MHSTTTRGYRQPHRRSPLSITIRSRARTWRGEDYCTDQQALTVLEMLLIGPARQKDLADALEVTYGMTLGTARAVVCGALLLLHEAGLITPIGRIDRSTVWSVIA